MIRKIAIAAAFGAIAIATPASAGNNWWGSTTSGGWHSHTCYCGHIKCTSTSSGTTTSTTSGTQTSTTSGTQVPEPGMLGLAGLGLIGLGAIRLRRRAKRV